MGLSWQQGPLSTGAIGRFLVPEPLPKRLLCPDRNIDVSEVVHEPGGGPAAAASG
jgi:hypothetical protein